MVDLVVKPNRKPSSTRRTTRFPRPRTRRATSDRSAWRMPSRMPAFRATAERAASVIVDLARDSAGYPADAQDARIDSKGRTSPPRDRAEGTAERAYAAAGRAGWRRCPTAVRRTAPSAAAFAETGEI